MKNGIVLIGMPGSGKSCIGRLLAKKLYLKHVDLDVEVGIKNRESIKEMFLKGEEYFRDKESDICKDFSASKNIVISTGGGVIKRAENLECFKDFLIVFLNRPLDKIIGDVEIDTRPLLAEGKEKLYQLYNDRLPLYKKYCDVEYINESSKDISVQDLLNIWNKEVLK